MKKTDMRSLSLEDRHGRRVQVIQLRRAGLSYDQIAAETRLSRTGVFDICKRHTALGTSALHDAPGGRKAGEGRSLTRCQEELLKGLIVANTPDELTMPEALWTRRAVSQLIEHHLGIRLPVRTLDSYLARWGFAPRRLLGKKGKSASAVLARWMIDGYPGVVAQAKAQGGEINWSDQQEVAGEDAQVPSAATPRQPPLRGRRQRLSMITSVTNSGRRRWNTFAGALDAPILIDFLRRLIRGTRKKVFLIMDDMQVPDDRPVAQWLVEHEDDIQAVHLPGPGTARAP